MCVVTMFFAAGMYGAGLAIHHGGLGVGVASLVGIAAALVTALLVGVVTRRTAGPAFLIVTMMLAQAFYLATLHFREWTMGDDGFIVASDLVVGGQGKGVFGIHYRVSGSVEEPDVQVNLLTVLAPGILRKMFVDPFTR